MQTEKPEVEPGGLLAFADAERSAPRKCIFARTRESLTERRQQELDYMIDRPEDYSVSLVTRTMNAVGGKLSRASVDQHLKSDCACFR